MRLEATATGSRVVTPRCPVDDVGYGVETVAAIAVVAVVAVVAVIAVVAVVAAVAELAAVAVIAVGRKQDLAVLTAWAAQ